MLSNPPDLLYLQATSNICMCTSRNKRTHTIWSRLPCPLQKILVLHRTQFYQEGRMLIFFTNRSGLKQRHTFLADSTEQRLVNTLKFPICDNSQWTIDSSKFENIRLTLTNFFQANRFALVRPPGHVTRKVEWDIPSGALKNTTCSAEARKFWCYIWFH